MVPKSASPQDEPKVPHVVHELTPDEILNLLGLEPNATCAFVKVTFVSKQAVSPGGLPPPFKDGRPLGSALYFMVTPSAPYGRTGFGMISSTTTIAAILWSYACYTPTEKLNAWSRDQTCAKFTECSSSYPAIHFTLRGWLADGGGSSAPAQSG
jgi:hypothetical protein